MSKWPMRGHFRYLRFKTFPMTPRTPQGEVFFPFLSSSKHSGVSEDSKSSLFPSVGLPPHTWPKQGCDMHILSCFASVQDYQMIPSKFKLIAYYDTSYTSPFLVKINSHVVCFHPGKGQFKTQRIRCRKNPTLKLILNDYSKYINEKTIIIPIYYKVQIYFKNHSKNYQT